MIKSTIKSSVLEQKINQYEESMKEKFIDVMRLKTAKYADCLDYIQNEINQSNKMASFKYVIPCFFNDGVYQLNQAICEVFGSVVSKEEHNPSGGSEVSTVDVTLADGTRVKVPYGKIELSGLGEEAYINIDYSTDSLNLLVNGKCQFRFSSMIDDIVEITKKNLKYNSIYKNQAIEVTTLSEPKILDLSNTDNQLMVLSDKIKYDLKPIHARIYNPEKCIEKGIPLKFGVLLSGSYGTGKSLLAFKLAREAVQNGWMFIYLKDPSLLADTLKMAKIIDHSGHGVIIFTEDVDQVTRGNRDYAMQNILNTLDGGDTKDMNVIAMFTTNHIELIEPTFLRGKRIGTIISMGPLDAKTAEEFIRKSFEIGCYTISEDLTEVCELIERSKIVPAFMAEIIEKVKSTMILEDECEVKAEYIKYSVESYLEQVKLSQTKDMSLTPEKRFVDSLREIFNEREKENDMNAFIEMMEDHCDDCIDNYRE